MFGIYPPPPTHTHTLSLSFVNQLRCFCFHPLLMELDSLLCVFSSNQHSGCSPSKSLGKTGCWPRDSKKGFKVKEGSHGVGSPRCWSLPRPSPRPPPLSELLRAPLLIPQAHVLGPRGEEVEEGGDGMEEQVEESRRMAMQENR